MSDRPGAGPGGADEELERALFGDFAATAPGPVASPAASEVPAPETGSEFDEQAYLRAYPDIARSIGEGLFASALEHYRRHGQAERRLLNPEYLAALRARDGVLVAIPGSVDAAILSDGGSLFVVGWTDDRGDPVVGLATRFDTGVAWHEGPAGRCRRSDVEGVLGVGPGHAFGFWSVITTPLDGISRPNACRLRVRRRSGAYSEHELPLQYQNDTDLRQNVLGYLGAAEFAGNRDVETFAAFDTGTGQELVRLNRRISGQITAGAHVQHYGPRREHYRASFIICLYGKPEWMFLQNALFSSAAGVEEIEFVYVSNSPELAEILHKQARINAQIYGLSVTLITLPGNAGFSAANNVAARHASSSRVVFVNPDVLPRDDGWAARHAAILDGAPRSQTMMFGALLYYDDGSLMHGGMYFESDEGLSVKSTGIESRRMLRVEHYGKGAPEWSDRHTGVRPVPAITGAFISVDRDWFELLGGFTEDHLFGHYEDADLCLKSLSRGFPCWMQDLRFWHLEGKGGNRNAAHDGGSLVNRWLFTNNWGRVVDADLLGPEPQHRLLRPAGLPSDAGPSVTPPRERGRVIRRLGGN